MQVDLPVTKVVVFPTISLMRRMFLLKETIYDWQYVDRLTGIYEEAGVSINREPYGPLTGTLVPPSMSNAVAIIEALFGSRTGSKKCNCWLWTVW